MLTTVPLPTLSDTPPLTPPSAPGEWSLAQIQSALSRPLPKNMLATRKQGGTMLEYIPWHLANRILDKYTPGWTWEIVIVTVAGDRLVLVGRLTIPTVEGNLYREATGTELLKEMKWIKDGNGSQVQDEYGRPLTEPVELAYGDPSSNAESMAFRRAAARFGLGLYLYEK
jgi:hypothetical protein